MPPPAPIAEDRTQALAALEQARAVLALVTNRFWRIKDDPGVPYDEVYQLHSAYKRAAREVVELEARIMSEVISPDADQLADLKRIHERMKQQVDNRAMIDGVLRLAALVAAL